MKTNCFQKYLGGVLMVLLCAAFELHAQVRPGGGPGGFGGFGGFGAFNNLNRGATTSSGQYNNNGTVGSAIISVDPVTHNIMVIADKETSEQISQVIASLDAPEPQVLIKVVFVEVQRQQCVRHWCPRRLHRGQQELFTTHRLCDQFHVYSRRIGMQPRSSASLRSTRP